MAGRPSGWTATIRPQINAALSFAVRSKKPTLIACRTIIGFGAPTKAGTNAVHGSPLGPKEASGAKALLDWHEPPFSTPEDVKERWPPQARVVPCPVDPG